MIKHEEYFDDRVSSTIINCVSRWLTDFSSRYQSGNGKVSKFLVNVQEQAAVYFKLLESEKKELIAAKRHWRVHFDLLSDYDELNACKSTMRLPKVGENIHLLPKHEMDRIVDPRNIPALIMDHKFKQASALAALRRDTASLRYLKNQSVEHVNAQQQEKEQPSCPVCLMEFNVADRAVLKCGHSLHAECIDEILKRSGGSNAIRCPMKCLNTTSKNEVLIAAAESLSKDDGSKISKKIEGSWGTKVDRLIADLIEVIDKGERCLVFSQWDDLLSIIESALSANHIAFTHPKGAKMFGVSAQALRSSCQVMLLNVKRGAEGLTLVEATHVFMIEPLLHCGLDAQAINRVHRIGQTAKTYVHRYIIKDTIEEKIDAIRMDRQVTFENVEEEDTTFVTSKNAEGKIQAGGLDGGFTSEELKDVLSTF
jgi:E3 ubiquitin-protein ligase SHPRH